MSHYDVCRIMMFVAYDIFECVAYRVSRSAATADSRAHKKIVFKSVLFILRLQYNTLFDNF